MAANDNNQRPNKRALLYASLFGLVAIVLPWISFDFALNVLLLGTALVLPWAALGSARRAREVATRKTRADAHDRTRRGVSVAYYALIAAFELFVAAASFAQLAVNVGWLQPMA